VIWIHRYELVPRARLSALAGAGARRGALIRIDGGVADIHPWPELGDVPLDEQLVRLGRGQTTPLTAQSLAFAREDAEARREGRSLFEGVTIPESHWPGREPPPGFDTVKLKSAENLPQGVRLRIDFNATLTPEEFLRIAETLRKERIDFIEDPCKYDAKIWQMLREKTGLRLALDRGQETEAVDVVVIKPAVQPQPTQDSALRTQDSVVTSYMDHPIGQLHAARVAARLATNPRCGLVTHVLFEPNAFSERLALDGARLVPPGGSGIGFDDLLETLAWTRLT
jgi:O-succinylbenzoate synthase